jgi:hypothetical protein
VGTVTYSGSSARVSLTATATGSAGGKLSGATVAMRVYSSSCTGTLLGTASATTGAAGTATFTLTTSTSGIYCAVATATHSGYQQGSAHSSFTVAIPKGAGRGVARAPEITAR